MPATDDTEHNILAYIVNNVLTRFSVRLKHFLVLHPHSFLPIRLYGCTEISGIFYFEYQSPYCLIFLRHMERISPLLIRQIRRHSVFSRARAHATESHSIYTPFYTARSCTDFPSVPQGVRTRIITSLYGSFPTPL